MSDDANEPITAEWLIASGAESMPLSDRLFFRNEVMYLTPVAKGKAWTVIVGGRMLLWTATTRGQIERLRRALRGDV